MFNKYRYNTGNSIIEVLVATAIVGVILTALAYSLGQSVKNSAQAEYRQIATRYAQDGMEFLRQQRTVKQWATFYSFLPAESATGYYCMPQPLVDATTFTTVRSAPSNSACSFLHASPPVTIYRTLRVTNKDTTPQSATVVVQVGWYDGTEFRSTSLTQTFRDY